MSGDRHRISQAITSSTKELQSNLVIMIKGTIFCVMTNECRYNRGVNVMVNSDELIGTTEYLTLKRGAV
jgi:hypothetical protein